MSRRFLIAAGGTGGHVYPALAIAEEIRKQDPNAHIHFAGGRRGLEGTLVPEHGFTISRFPAAGMRGLGIAGVIRFASAFSVAFIGALLLVLRFRPQLVLATGGYASAAPAVAAVFAGKSFWLQEQNSVPGSTNRFLSRFAQRAYLAFPEAALALSKAKVTFEVPNPVRNSLREEGRLAATAEDYESFGLSSTKPVLFVFGGSRGARRLSESVCQAIEELMQESD